MLRELKNGDVVATSGGMVGTIVSMEGDNLVLRVKPDNLKIQFLRSAVSGRVSEESSK
jgi:preprotein translocase subunit YajC